METLRTERTKINEDTFEKLQQQKKYLEKGIALLLKEQQKVEKKLLSYWQDSKNRELVL